jgi:HlyD family secretion protein
MTHMKKPLILTLLFLGTVGLGARAYYSGRTGTGPNISTAPVTRGSLMDTVGATGTLQAVTTVQVGTQVSGTISWLGADFNSIVRKGQIVAKLDPAVFEAQVEQSRATVTRTSADLDNAQVKVADAQQKYDRAKELAERELIAQSDLDAAKTTLDAAEAAVRSSRAQVVQAKAALDLATLNLSHTVITAPIDGIVIGRSVDAGQTVAASFSSPTIFSIAADLAEMQLNANIDESDIGSIRPGERATFQVDAYPNERFTGTVSQVRLQPNVVQNVTTYNVIIDVPNRDLKLKPGMTANVSIEIASRDDVVKVPNAALRFRPTTAIFEALGQTPPERGSQLRPNTGAAPAAGETAAGTKPESSETRAAADTASRNPKATTIDALFGPLPRPETEGRVWVLENDQLKPVSVTLGITDGQATELIAGNLDAGAALVTNITTAAAAAAQAVAPPAGLFPSGGVRGVNRQGAGR